MPMAPWIRAYLDEPAVPGAPRRVWRDWVLVAVAVVGAVVETALRHDIRWPVGALVVCLAAIPTLLIRRTRPLLALGVAFGLMLTFSLIVWIAAGPPGGLGTGIFVLVVLYAVYRWGSGRDGLIAGGITLAAAVIGNLTDARTAGDVIGGVVVLCIPILLGLLVRSRSLAGARRVEAVRALERERLARELHDTVAHHVSAIAVQAQAGKAVAATRPQAAVDVLDVIEREASRTLVEMRAIVGALRAGDGADLAPLPGLADLARLGANQPVAVEASIGDGVADLDPTIGTTLYRIAQEAVTNAVRHGTDVQRVRIEVRRDGERVRLTVDDDGRPSAVSRPAVSGGYGLAGMAERAGLLGGELTAGPSSSGRGWRVLADLPVGEVTQ